MTALVSLCFLQTCTGLPVCAVALRYAARNCCCCTPGSPHLVCHCRSCPQTQRCAPAAPPPWRASRRAHGPAAGTWGQSVWAAAAGWTVGLQCAASRGGQQAHTWRGSTTPSASSRRWMLANTACRTERAGRVVRQAGSEWQTWESPAQAGAEAASCGSTPHHGEAVAGGHLRGGVQRVVDHRRGIQRQCGVAAEGQVALGVQSWCGWRLRRCGISGASLASCRTQGSKG